MKQTELLCPNFHGLTNLKIENFLKVVYEERKIEETSLQKIKIWYPKKIIYISGVLKSAFSPDALFF